MFFCALDFREEKVDKLETLSLTLSDSLSLLCVCLSGFTTARSLLKERSDQATMTTLLSTTRTGGFVFKTTTATVGRRSLRKSSSRRHSYVVQKFSRATSASSTNTSSGECELVECEANFGEEGGGVKGAKINGKEISASAMRRLTLTNQFNEQVVLPQTENKKDVIVYLRHLG